MNTANCCPYCNKPLAELHGELLPVSKPGEYSMGRAAVLSCSSCGKILSVAFDQRSELRDVESKVEGLDRRVGSLDRVLSDVAFKISRLR